MTDSALNDATVSAWLARNARDTPDKLAIRSIEQNKDITHGELFSLANRIGRYFEAQGIRPNDRIALLSSNSIEHLAVYLASLAYGCTICTIHVEMNASYFEDILNAINAKIVLCEANQPDIEALSDKVPGDWQTLGTWDVDGGTGAFEAFAVFDDSAGKWPLVDRTDDASIFYTSGTSSRPKGVVCSYAELFDNVLPIANAFGMNAEDRILDFRSMNWMSAQVLSALSPIAKGATLLLARKFSASRFFDWANENNATIAAGNPTTLNMLVNREASRGHNASPCMRFITSSSAPLLVSEWQRFEETFGIHVCQGYGASEVGWIAGSNENSRKLGSVGRPVPYQQVTIVDPDGKQLRTDEIGAIQLNGNPAGRYRYLGEDGEIYVNAEGSALTGDLGFIDSDGYLFVTGREKDLIIRGGVNISPLEIDNIVLQIPKVAEVATVGVPDAIYGEQVVVFVEVKQGATLSAREIIAHCEKHLADFKLPRNVLFRDELPKTSRGKMDRNALVEDWKSSQTAA